MEAKLRRRLHPVFTWKSSITAVEFLWKCIQKYSTVVTSPLILQFAIIETSSRAFPILIRLKFKMATDVSKRESAD